MLTNMPLFVPLRGIKGGIYLEATGLERASLYHRFPDGKEQMAEYVLLHLQKQLEVNLFAPLRVPGEAREKLALAVKVIDEFYQSGHLPCVLETLCLEGVTPGIRQALAAMTSLPFVLNLDFCGLFRVNFVYRTFGKQSVLVFTFSGKTGDATTVKEGAFHESSNRDSV